MEGISVKHALSDEAKEGDGGGVCACTHFKRHLLDQSLSFCCVFPVLIHSGRSGRCVMLSQSLDICGVLKGVP